MRLDVTHKTGESWCLIFGVVSGAQTPLGCSRHDLLQSGWGWRSRRGGGACLVLLLSHVLFYLRFR